jgi:hypothetical protein
MGGHREIPVKVTAWVDEGVATLVLALNEWPDVETCGSCENGPKGGAYVLFRARGDNGKQLAADLAAVLTKGDPDGEWLIRAEWRPTHGAGEPLLELACPTERVGLTARLVSASRRTA